MLFFHTIQYNVANYATNVAPCNLDVHFWGWGEVAVTKRWKIVNIIGGVSQLTAALYNPLQAV